MCWRCHRPKHEVSKRVRHYATHSHYDTLSLGRNATAKEVKARFYELSKKHHPDVEPQSAKLFTEINAAYSVLRNDRSRRDYDRTLGVERGPVPGQSSSGYRASGLSRRKTKPMGTAYSAAYNPSSSSYSSSRPAGFEFGANPSAKDDVRNQHFEFEQHRERHSAFDSRYSSKVQDELSRRNTDLQDNFIARFLGIAGLVVTVIILTGGISKVRAEVMEEYRAADNEARRCRAIDWERAIQSRRQKDYHESWR